MKSFVLFALTAALSAGVLSGCSSGSSSDNPLGDPAGTQAKASQVAKQLKEGADKTQVDAKSDLESAKVWGALKASSGLETNEIKVDTDEAAKTIKLTGSVPSKAQKEQAQTVTKGLAGSEYKVVDELQVADASSTKPSP